uniref:Histone H2B subacrosomal variant-like n=1 Tax=Castor canadensis TaxID=51338 RepID=A0A8C0W2Y1_CASCN|nr:histone H2B subacrosomal variant-like [Castor canadensis]
MARSVIQKHRSIRRHVSSIYRKKSYCRVHFGHRNYSLYVNKVLKEVVPHGGISSRTFNVMNILINDIFARIAMEAHHQMHLRNRCTLTPEDVQKAVYLLCPRKLAKHAVAFGSEVVHRFVHS